MSRNDPRSERILRFLIEMFPEDGVGFPEKVSCSSCFGARPLLGPVIKEFPFKPNAAAPTREHLVEVANEILQRAQDDCDELDKPTRYAVRAADRLGLVTIELRPRSSCGLDLTAWIKDLFNGAN